MKKLKIVLTLILAFLIYALTSPPQLQAGYSAGSTNACANAQNYKYAAISVTSATTVGLVTLVTSNQVYVCGYYIASVGGTSQLEYGTGATCTAPTVLTGAFAAASTVNVPVNGQTQLATPASQAVCIVGGTGTTATAGVLVYVQQ